LSEKDEAKINPQRAERLDCFSRGNFWNEKLKPKLRCLQVWGYRKGCSLIAVQSLNLGILAGTVGHATGQEQLQDDKTECENTKSERPHLNNLGA
jgi:hypothetical protein